jgi:hypothetical protein
MVQWRLIAGAASLALAGFLAPAAAQAPAAESVEVAPGLKASVVSLKRLPGKPLVQLDYVLENTGDATVDLGDAGLAGIQGLSGIGLLDFANETEYRIGTADDCLCSDAPEDNALARGARFEGWAWFSPPATADGPLAVRFGSARPILDVPLE